MKRPRDAHPDAVHPHTFHLGCLAEWYASGKRKLCPLCNVPITQPAIVPKIGNAPCSPHKTPENTDLKGIFLELHPIGSQEKWDADASQRARQIAVLSMNLKRQRDEAKRQGVERRNAIRGTSGRLGRRLFEEVSLTNRTPSVHRRAASDE